MNARSVGFLLALVGIAVVAHPLYLFPHHGETPYYLSGVEPVGNESVAEQPSAETIAYADLPPVAKDRFAAELDGGSQAVWSGEHAATHEAFSTHEYVRYRGERYEYRLGHSDYVGLSGMVRPVLSALGAVALAVGGLVARTERFRPLTPRRALWLPVGTFGALAATEVYDAALGGAPEPQSYVFVPALAAAFVAASVAGSRAKRRPSLRVVPPVATTAAVVIALSVAFRPANGGIAAAVGVVLAVSGPWFAVGYGLTASPEEI